MNIIVDENGVFLSVSDDSIGITVDDFDATGYTVCNDDSIVNLAKVLIAKKYLNDTDFYYARKLESGDDVPEDVVTKRVYCREFIRKYEA